MLTALKALMLKTLHAIIKVGTTYNVGPIICVPFANEGKTQVGWAIATEQRAQR